jgi:uncharacterized protein (DUF927 family)
VAKRDPNVGTLKRAAGTDRNAPANPPLPGGFRYGRDGRIEYKDKNGAWHWLCTPLEVVAATRDAENSNWGRLLRVCDRDGHWHTWAMPMAMTSGGADEVLKVLLSLGLESCPGGGKALPRLLVEAPTERRVRCVDRPGWHAGAFVLPERTIAGSIDEQLILQTRAIAPAQTSGSLEDWQLEVGAVCASSSRLTFALSAALAAPLLHIAGVENGGFHFRGPSSIGKTTMLKVAASLWGDPNGYASRTEGVSVSTRRGPGGAEVSLQSVCLCSTVAAGSACRSSMCRCRSWLVSMVRETNHDVPAAAS